MSGRGRSPHEVLALAMGLPPGCLTKALMRGSRDYEGWDIQMAGIAALYDALNYQTQATGNWRNKPPTLPTFPRPKGDEKIKAQEKKTRTVADLFRQFAG